MKKIILLTIMLVGLLVGCSSTKNHENHSETGKEFVPIEVNITMSPEKAQTKEEITIQAQVTQGKDMVDDANEVKFEIREKDNADNSEKIVAKNAGKGIYFINKTFSENGQYIVIAHVTARSMHAMPSKEFVVGEIGGNQVEESSDTSSTEHGHGQHHETTVEIDLLNKNSYKIGNDNLLKAKISHENEPIKQADVTFEVWGPEEKNHKWIDAKEEGDGIYTGSIAIDKKGTFHIQVHVKQEEIHEHQVFMFDVK